MDNGRFKEADFLLLQACDGTRLAILKSDLAEGLGYEEQAARLPEGFKPISLKELEVFIESFQLYPKEMGRGILVWTSTTNKTRRAAVVINSAHGIPTVVPLPFDAFLAYTGAPIVIAAIKRESVS